MHEWLRNYVYTSIIVSKQRGAGIIPTRTMHIKHLTLGPYQTNCYILTQNQEVLIIDPSAKGDYIASHIDPTHTVVAIVLTHGHCDHFGGAQALLDRYHCPLYIHEADIALLEDPMKNYSMHQNITIHHNGDVLVPGIMQIGSFSFFVMHTPGHSPGSVSLLFDNHLFVGDLIFKGSMGRTDLYGGNEREMMKSLRLLKSLSANLKLYPGHGTTTHLDIEKANNPFLIQA